MGCQGRLLGFAVPALCATTLVVGCAEVGGQTGTEDTTSPPLTAGPSTSARVVHIPTPTGNPRCIHDAPIALASLDDAPSGFSARDVLALAEVSGQFPLTWNTESPTGSRLRKIEPPSGPDSDAIFLTVSYAGGEILHLGPPGCSRLDVEVEVTMRSESGALDENVTAVLYALEPAFDETGGVRLEFVLRPAGVVIHMPLGPLEGRPTPRVAPQGGDLDVRMAAMDGESMPPDPGWLAAVPILLWFDQGGVHGTIDAWLHATRTVGMWRAREIGTVAGGFDPESGR